MFFGINALAGFLKKNGHTADVLIEPQEKNFILTISEIKPDIIGFSLMSNDYEWFIEKAALVKKNFPGTLIITGGTHAYLSPELIELPFIDIVCVGEGEKPLLNLLNALSAGNDYSVIKNLNVKINGKIVRNKIEPPILTLDEIPEDRSIYIKRYPYFKNEILLQVISSRGCPLSCTFCINSKINQVYKGISSKYHRQKSPDFLIKELKELKQLFPKISTVFFADDLFLADRKFVGRFTELYKLEISLPYIMNVFPFYIDDEIAKLLSESQCRTVMVAPETGNENHRFKIFGKKIKNYQFIEMSKIVKKYGITIYSTAIFVYPEQTLEDVFKTIELHHAMQADYPFKSFLQPYPNTEIYDIAVKNNNIASDFGFKDLPRSYFINSCLKHPEKKNIVLIYYFYYFLVLYPFLYKIIKKRFYLLKIIPLKNLISFAGIFLWFKNWKNMSYISAFLYIIRFRKDK